MGLVDIGNSLSEIERSILAVVNTLDLQQSLIFILLDLASIQELICEGVVKIYLLKPRNTAFCHNLDRKSQYYFTKSRRIPDGSTSLSGGLSDLLRSLSNLGGLLGGFGHLFFSLN